jgi:hypothetical protein
MDSPPPQFNSNPPLRTRIQREVPTLLTGARARAASSTSVVIDPSVREKAMYDFLKYKIN